MTTEKVKMITGENYLASDQELVNDRLACRERLQRLNSSISTSSEWRNAIDALLPHANGAYLEPPFYCDYGYNIKAGKNFYTNFNCIILDVAPVTIGDNVLFAPNVQIYTAGHPLDVKSRVEQGVEFGKPISIGNNVWLGGGVIVCPGVSIGENSVIGAGSVVTKNIPSNVIAVGNPCRVISTISE